jgi:hypothetical protein
MVQYSTIEDPVIQKFLFEIQVFAKAEVSDLRSFVSTRKSERRRYPQIALR